jgi:hypothetical protein
MFGKRSLDGNVALESGDTGLLGKEKTPAFKQGSPLDK